MYNFNQCFLRDNFVYAGRQYFKEVTNNVTKLQANQGNQRDAQASYSAEEMD